MRYEFVCECNEMKEFYAPITEGPPEEVLCDVCEGKMWQNYGTNVVFRGDGWIDKDLRRERNGDDGHAIEHHEESMRDHKNKKKNQNEVLAERRKGTKHMKEWSKKNPAKWRNYKNNVDDGIRGGNE